MSINCGAPVRYWRLGFFQLGTPTVGHLAIASLLVTDTIRGSNNLITQASEVSLSHTPGVIEVTEPVGPVLDGAVLIDGDNLTYARADWLDPTNPLPWFINIDTGVDIGIVEIALELFSQHRGGPQDWYILVQLSANNVDFQTVDALAIPANALTQEVRLHIVGRGYTELRNYIPKRGGAMIPGIASENSAVKPNSRVFVFERDTMALVGATLTDQNGNYIVYGLDLNTQYLSIVVDDDGSPKKQPVPWDHVYPSPAHKLSNLEYHHWHNRYEISKGDIAGLYFAGLTPTESVGVALGDFWTNDPETVPPTSDNGSYQLGMRTVSSFAPLRADVTAVRINRAPGDASISNTGYRMMGLGCPGSNIGNTGLAMECVFGKETGQELWMAVVGDFKNTPHATPSWISARGSGNQYEPFYWGVNSAVQETLLVKFTDTEVRVVAEFSAGGRADVTQTLPTPLTDNSLHHMVVSVENGVAIKIYIDGVEVFDVGIVGFGEQVRSTASTRGASYQPTDAPAHLGGVIFHSEQYSRHYLDEFHVAMVALYARGLSPTEAGNLWLEAQGTYTDAAIVYNESGYQAEVLADVPSLYLPLQDVTTADIAPARAYPNANAQGTAGYQTELLPGSMLYAQTIPNSNRVGFKLIEDGEYQRGFVLGLGLMNTQQRTLGGSFKLSVLPTAGAVYLLRVYSDIGNQLVSTVSRYMHQVWVLLNGQLQVKFAPNSGGNGEAVVTFSYVVPINTHITYYVVMDLLQGTAKLYINGALVETQAAGGGFMYGWAVRAAFGLPDGANTELIVHDLVVYDHALPADRIAAQYQLL